MREPLNLIGDMRCSKLLRDPLADAWPRHSIADQREADSIRDIHTMRLLETRPKIASHTRLFDYGLKDTRGNDSGCGYDTSSGA